MRYFLCYISFLTVRWELTFWLSVCTSNRERLLKFDGTGINLIPLACLGVLKIMNMFYLPSVVGGRSVGRSVCFFGVVGIAVNYHELVSKYSYIYNFLHSK